MRLSYEKFKTRVSRIWVLVRGNVVAQPISIATSCSLLWLGLDLLLLLGCFICV